MKICVLFTGTISTGKTTLLEKVKKELDELRFSYSIITSVVRELVKKNIIEKEVDILANNKNQITITAEYTCQYWEKLQDDSIILLSDRSPIDLIAYSRCRKDASDYSNRLAERVLNNLFSFKGVKFLVFYFPPIIPFEKDEIREEKGRKKIDIEIKKILKEFKIPFIKMEEADLQKRSNLIRDIIITYYTQSSSRD